MKTKASPEDTSVLTVTELTQSIKKNLETTYPSVSIQGEISNFKRQSSGHLYFSLKDNFSQISAVMFRGHASKLKTYPKDGDQVTVKGGLNVYQPRGNYQIVIQKLSLVGIGELLLKLEELKKEIHKRGWFAKTHKKQIPQFPKTIGVITSPTGAAIQDILNILGRRYSSFNLILNPVKVQGVEAASEITQAIEQFNQYKLVDVMIVGRGGGSIEDLWAFNEEIVASAIFNSKIPIICAVGHETDHCIAEYVADTRAPTPSAAAELVIAEKAQYLQTLKKQKYSLKQTLQHLIKQYRQKLKGVLHHPIFTSDYALLGPWLQKIDDLRQNIDVKTLDNIQKKKLQLESFEKQLFLLKPTHQIDLMKQKLAKIHVDLHTTIQLQLSQFKEKHTTQISSLDNFWEKNYNLLQERFKRTIESIKAIDPKNLLKQGYSILFDETGEHIINSTKHLAHNKKVFIQVSDGKVKATINSNTL